MNERVSVDGFKNRITYSQIRNTFKKLVCECKSVSQRTANGLRENGGISFHHW